MHLFVHSVTQEKRFCAIKSWKSALDYFMTNDTNNFTCHNRYSGSSILASIAVTVIEINTKMVNTFLIYHKDSVYLRQ